MMQLSPAPHAFVRLGRGHSKWLDVKEQEPALVSAVSRFSCDGKVPERLLAVRPLRKDVRCAEEL